MLDRIEYAQARIGAVARKQDHLDVLLAGRIEAQQLVDQRERGSRHQQFVLVRDLIAVIGVHALLGVDAMTLGEIEQRARGDRDDQFSGKRGPAMAHRSNAVRRWLGVCGEAPRSGCRIPAPPRSTPRRASGRAPRRRARSGDATATRPIPARRSGRPASWRPGTAPAAGNDRAKRDAFVQPARIGLDRRAFGRIGRVEVRAGSDARRAEEAADVHGAHRSSRPRGSCETTVAGAPQSGPTTPCVDGRRFFGHRGEEIVIERRVVELDHLDGRRGAGGSPTPSR